MVDEIAIQTIIKRLDELNTEFEKVKKQLLEAEEFVLKSKEHLVSLRGAYAELEALKDIVTIKDLPSSDISKEDVQDEDKVESSL